MKALLVGCLALAACDDGIGITVTVPAGVTRVDLFIGETDCVNMGHGCPGIGPPGGVFLPGEVFWVDNVEPFGVEVPAGASEVAFRLEAGEGTIPVIVAVGSGQQLAVAILRDIELGSGAINYVATLVPAESELGTDAVASTNAFTLWAEPQPTPQRFPNRCLGAQTDDGQRVFVVPTDDFDCDDIASDVGGCELVAGASSPFLPIEQTTCAAPRKLDDTLQHCMLGGPSCDPDGGGLDSCENRNEICISDAMCCPEADASVCFETAFLQAIDSLSALSIVCGISYLQDPGTGEITFCTQETDPGQSAPLPTAGAADCGNPQIGALQFPFGPFEDKLIYNPDPAHEIKLFPKLDQGCNLGLGWIGSADGNTLQNTMVMVMIETGSMGQGSGRSVVLPVQVVYTPAANDSCPGQNLCHIQPGMLADSVLGCLR